MDEQNLICCVNECSCVHELFTESETEPIYYLKQKGWTNVQIAEFTGHQRDTIARVLREDVDTQPKTRNRTSAVAVFDAQIAQWLDKNLLVSRMLELYASSENLRSESLPLAAWHQPSEVSCRGDSADL